MRGTLIENLLLDHYLETLGLSCSWEQITEDGWADFNISDLAHGKARTIILATPPHVPLHRLEGSRAFCECEVKVYGTEIHIGTHDSKILVTVGEQQYPLKVDSCKFTVLTSYKGRVILEDT